MNESLFSRLFRYKQTEKMSQTENYLTETLAWMINNLPKFGQEYVLFLISKHKEAIDFHAHSPFTVSATTQFTVTNGFIDMVITTDNNMIFICEHKVDSELSDNQIQKYYDCRGEIENSPEYLFKTVLLTKSVEQQTQKSDIAFIWHDLYLYVSKQYDNNVYDDSEKIIIKQFLLYLTEVGMGMKNRIQIGSVENYCEVMKLDQTLKGMFCEIKNDIKWDTKCSGLADFVASYHPEIPVKRWGRIGIEFSNEWKPNIFAGVVLDNADHKLKEFNNQPQFVVLIDCDPEVKSEVLNKAEFKSLFANIPNCENDFSIDKSPKNKWRLLILQKPLKDVLKHSEYEEQKKDITDEIIAGINMILKYYNSNK